MTIISYRYKPAFFSKRYKTNFSSNSANCNLPKNQFIFSSKEIICYLKILIFSSMLLFSAYALVIHQAIVFGYQIDKEKKTAINYEIENQNLRADLSAIKSIKNMEELALTRGLQVENKPIYIKIDSVKMALNN